MDFPILCCGYLIFPLQQHIHLSINAIFLVQKAKNLQNDQKDSVKHTSIVPSSFAMSSGKYSSTFSISDLGIELPLQNLDDWFRRTILYIFKHVRMLRCIHILLNRLHLSLLIVSASAIKRGKNRIRGK